jgi:GNAT superfamily N-acetyltransferase
MELDDRPGALARVTTRLADRDCNVLALAVLPVPGGVVDELVVRISPGMLPADLVELVRAEGGRNPDLAPADVRELVDTPTAALRAAAGALTDGPANAIGLAEAVRTVLAADAVEVLRDGDPDGERAAGGHRLVVSNPRGPDLLARRGWTPFTEVELARAAALTELLAAARTSLNDPVAVLTSDGAGVVLRLGGPDDTLGVEAMHGRCSMHTLFSRYHAGTRNMPRRWLHRLLNPPRGHTLVATYGPDVVAMGQLLRAGAPDVGEVSLLVEDVWQRRGIGTAVLTQLAAAARSAGCAELVAWAMPGETALPRTARRAGLATTVRHEHGLLRVGIMLNHLSEATEMLGSPAAEGQTDQL